MDKYAIRPTVESDIDWVSSRLREEDKREIARLGVDPISAVRLSAAMSNVTRTGFIDGEAAIIFGLELKLWEEYSSIWALGTAKCNDGGVGMVRYGRQVVAEFLEICPALENWCDAEYESSLKWLRLLGFTVEQPAEYGPLKALFCRLSIRKGEEKCA